ncbi:MAG: hypothetical protein SCJ97_11700, partial [Bacillota bacterium]|nr:hypothetical protein [Bacillota bacterium]
MTKHLKKRSLIIIAVTLITLLTAGAYVYFTYFTLNPLLESQLRSQFGDEFFDDFAEEPEPENDSELLDDIIEKYEPHFETLENRALERLEELFTAAVEEYNQQR